jgi:hypothetical protein
MANVQATPTAAPASSSTASAAATATIGSKIDAEVTILESRLTALESAAKTDWARFISGFKSNWAHYATWAGLGVVIAKLFGKL